MDEKLILEKEMNAPLFWKTDTIFIRDGKGNIIEIEVPDDKEE